jgi:RNA polymerase primary sigma factor
MASKANKGQGEDMESSDAPLLDLNEASVKKLIARATKRGYITYDELNEPCRRTRCRPSRSRT